MEIRIMNGEDENVLAENVNGDSEDVENGGVGPGDAEEQGVSTEEQGLVSDADPLSVKKRLGMQAKKHKQEIRKLHDRISQMQSMMGSERPNPHASSYQPDPYPSPGQPSPVASSEEDRIRQAVNMALGAQEEQKRQAFEAEQAAQVQRHYKRLNDEFDSAMDKYEDFDDAVRNDELPFTANVRDALLMIENAPDVAYRLAKNKSDLERISKLPPIDLIREINKLSFALRLGKEDNKGSQGRPSPLGNARPNPVGSQAITDKTPASVIRARMKAGEWK